ncbi:hypothetical protein [Chelatococcus reniformis]|uniref:Uncharacterized protein n=1 Tax=Chelatococcus reniformis TaxID=1494448 RepID=A0A916UFC4_9HYPH|nr:hypothetical protein [Chelatococcus reniformis]GGC70956.1 hypothetical protein GCM10010994_31850 [Chelatococcus reniformis]
MKFVSPYNDGGDPNASWVDGNPGTGTEGSIPRAAAFEHPLRELDSLIAYNNLVPSGADLQQVTKAVRAQWINYAGVATGTADAWVLTLPNPQPTAWSALTGVPIRWRAAYSNTGGCTVDLGFGIKTCRASSDRPLARGDIIGGGFYEGFFDGTYFVVLNTSTLPQAAYFPNGPLVAGLYFDRPASTWGGAQIPVSGSEFGGTWNSGTFTFTFTTPRPDASYFIEGEVEVARYVEAQELMSPIPSPSLWIPSIESIDTTDIASKSTASFTMTATSTSAVDGTTKRRRKYYYWLRVYGYS